MTPSNQSDECDHDIEWQVAIIKEQWCKCKKKKEMARYFLDEVV